MKKIVKNIYIFLHNTWEIERNIIFQVLNLVEELHHQNHNTTKLKFCMNIDIVCMQVRPPLKLCKQYCLPVNKKNSARQYFIKAVNVFIYITKWFRSYVNES